MLAARGDAGSGPLCFCKIDSWWIPCRIEGGRSRFNKIARHITCSEDQEMECCYPPLAGRGGEEGRRCCVSSSRSEEQLLLVRFVLQEIWDRSCCMAEEKRQPGKLQRMEETVCIIFSATSAIKRFVNRKHSGDGVDLDGFLLAHLGGEEKRVHSVHTGSPLGLHQGRSADSLGRFLTVASCRRRSSWSIGDLSHLWRRLRLSGWRLKDFFNLLAAMPFRRPSSYGAVCSRPLVPSGMFPGDEDGDCPELWKIRAGDGAGSNCFSKFLLRVLCAICRGMDVILNFLEALSVNCSGVD